MIGDRSHARFRQDPWRRSVYCADQLTGDRFVYLSTADSKPNRRKRDTILDFNIRQGDTIDLSVIDANARRATRSSPTSAPTSSTASPVA
jgi:hypothetical protein